MSSELSFTIIVCTIVAAIACVIVAAIVTPSEPVCWTFESVNPRTCVKPRGQLNSGACFPTAKEAADFATSQRLKICGAGAP